jgi:hypothetical protein
VLSLAEGRRREGDVGLIEYAQVVDNLLVSDSWLHGQERAHEDGGEHECIRPVMACTSSVLHCQLFVQTRAHTLYALRKYDVFAH